MPELIDEKGTAWCLDHPAAVANVFVITVVEETVLLHFGYWDGKKENLPPRGRSAVALRRGEALHFANHIVKTLNTTVDLPAK
jgi:hypothetical protein